MRRNVHKYTPAPILQLGTALMSQGDGVSIDRGHSPPNPPVRKSLNTSTAPVEVIPRVTFR